VPDDAMQLELSSSNGVPQELRFVPSTPGNGPHADLPVGPLPMVDLGYGTNDPAIDLRGRAALIQRGPPGSFPDDRNTFRRKIERAAIAGAAFAVIYNNVDHTSRINMADTDFVPIPAVMITQDHGEALRDLLPVDPLLRAELKLTPARATFAVTDTLVCEHVGVRLQMTHARRGDVRITLVSPQGTRSVLQHINLDNRPFPSNWTYWSTRHYGEASAGNWLVEVSDEAPGEIGSVNQVELILTGVVIADADSDGLEDAWEQAWFGSLSRGPRDDPDGDLLSNARERWMNTKPSVSDLEFRSCFSPWTPTLGRLAWTSTAGHSYDIEAAVDVAQPFSVIATVSGQSPETEWFTPLTNSPFRLFRIQQR
jgi:subtilisin-like proprotein convertase family protein